MWGGVMLKFGGRKEIQPGFRVISTEDMKVRFYFLIGTFSLSVGLRMVGSGESDVILEESSQFLSEGRGELGSSIGYQRIM